jgi:hypothetical protein
MEAGHLCYSIMEVLLARRIKDVPMMYGEVRLALLPRAMLTTPETSANPTLIPGYSDLENAGSTCPRNPRIPNRKQYPIGPQSSQLPREIPVFVRFHGATSLQLYGTSITNLSAELTSVMAT